MATMIGFVLGAATGVFGTLALYGYSLREIISQVSPKKETGLAREAEMGEPESDEVYNSPDSLD